MAGNPFPNTIALAALGAANGFKLQGEASSDDAGEALAGIGDVNDDGIPDLIIGAQDNNDFRGAGYVVFGGQNLSGTIDLDTIGGAVAGFKLQGEVPNDQAGLDVSGAGDINGDGIDDFLVGARFASFSGPDGGSVYVVFGRDDPFPALIDLATVAQGEGGFRLDGEAGSDRAGAALAAAGDVNGDGFDDFLVGARFAGDGGVAYLVLGTDQGFPDIGNLGDVGGSIPGTRFESVDPLDRAGISVAGLGDVNGDGLDDFVIGADVANDDVSGAAYVVFGKASGLPGTVGLDEVGDTIAGFAIIGEAAFDNAGNSVAGVGDVNGDGIADILIGARENDAGGSERGAAYVVFGRAATDPFPAQTNLAALDGEVGFKIEGEDDDDDAGVWVAAAGDVNGDGIADILIGADGNDNSAGNNAGAAYVVFGRTAADPFPEVVQLSDIAQGIGGFKVEGEVASDDLGLQVDGIGDFNQDGVDDIFLGARDNASGGNNAGAAYVIYGNIAPVAENDTADAVGGELITLDILSNDTDENGSLVPASLALVDGPAKGTAVINDGKVDYTPNPGESGQDTFTYTVLDDQGGISNEATVTVSINTPPTANPDSAAVGFLASTVIDVLANDTDPEGNATLDPSSVAIVDGPGLGTATVNPDGTIGYTATAFAIGTDSFTYTVADNQGATSNEATVTVTVGQGVNVVNGTNRGEDLAGTGGPDIILGQGGVDRILGRAGADILFGGRGDDYLQGQGGNDILVGGPGNDLIEGGPGLDVAIYDQPFSRQDILHLGSQIRVQDGNRFVDTLTTVELLQFDDGVYEVASRKFTAGAYATPEVEALVTSDGFSTNPGPITPSVSVAQVETLVVQGEVG